VKITPDIIDLVKSSIDIVDVVSDYFPLKRSGRNYKALCPFHQEKTPSFMVNADRQIFRCFGCGAGGDVIEFVMKQEGYSFMEALRALAERGRVSLPETTPENASRRERLLRLHETAAGFYHWVLTKSDRGRAGREYLEARGFDRACAQDFQLGYALPGWDSFLKHAHRRGFRDEELVEGGLAVRNEQGRVYDRFRGRLIIPIRDPRGRVIAFGARVLGEADDAPKYINSPESPLFQKGRVLFGLDRARRAIDEAGEVILGEGYLDVIRAHRAGISTMVCSQGTAFTPDQALLLRRHAERVVTAFDADAAGQAASLRGLDIFLEKNFEVRIALMPAGHDPDSFIRDRGGEAFLRLAAAGIPLLDYKLERLCACEDIASPAGKRRVAHAMLETVRRVESPMLRETYLKRIAARLGVSEQALVREGEGLPGAAPIRPPRRDGVSPREKGDKFERNLLKILLHHDSIAVFAENDLDPRDFSPGLRHLVERMVDLIREKKFPLARQLPLVVREEGEQSLVSAWLFDETPPAPARGEVGDYLCFLKRRSLSERSRVLEEEIERVEKQGGDIAGLQKDRMALDRLLRALPREFRERYEEKS